MNRPYARLAAATLIAVAMVPACGSDDNTAATTTATTTADTDSAPAGTTTPPGDTGTASDEVDVTEPVPTAATIAPDSTQASTTAATAATAATDDDTVAATWSTVFDSTIGFDTKAALLEDAAGLQGTVEAYTEAGSAMGGITLEPTAVAVDGDTATVTYDVLFGGSPAYTDQEGMVVRVDGTWIVPREEFCSFMASARNPCPAG